MEERRTYGRVVATKVVAILLSVGERANVLGNNTKVDQNNTKVENMGWATHHSKI